MLGHKFLCDRANVSDIVLPYQMVNYVNDKCMLRNILKNYDAQ